MSRVRVIDLPIEGMDCAECTQHVQSAIARLNGVESVGVFLATEKATVHFDPERVDLSAIRQAVQSAGYAVTDETPSPTPVLEDYTRRVATLLALLFGVVLFVAVVGEWLGLFERITDRIPWPVGLMLVLLGGYPVFLNVIRAALRRQVISHTLMTLGVVAALVVGEWVTAAVVVFFMRVGDYVESFTTERARHAVRDLAALAPQIARIERDGQEAEVGISEVREGDTVIVRPGEKIPVDGEVIEGQATVDQSAITGESLPAEVGPGANVYAATLARLGHLKIRTAAAGTDTTFGRVVKMVEEAEAHRADVQRIADRFSTWYLPLVAGIAALTFLISRNPLYTAAVLVVACSCSIALATPIAMLASVGAAAKRGIMIKGGRYLELLAKADVLLIDKTGTLTLGRPEITDVIALDGLSEPALLGMAASAERYSEHPLAEAVRSAAARSHLPLEAPHSFQAVPGVGVHARLEVGDVGVGSRRLLDAGAVPAQASRLESEGKTLLFVQRDGQLVGILAASDTLRSEVPAALDALRGLGLHQLELLTGDNERTAAALAQRIGVAYRAELLPEDKIRIVREYQAQGRTVVMVGDGVNDAPALAQADVGIAMGAAGSDIAIEAAHIALMREDWTLVPRTFAIARRTMRIVRMNLGFTALYNVVGLSLAAFGFLPPILAAAAQSLPDLGILGNSSRLLRQD